MYSFMKKIVDFGATFQFLLCCMNFPIISLLLNFILTNSCTLKKKIIKCIFASNLNFLKRCTYNTQTLISLWFLVLTSDSYCDVLCGVMLPSQVIAAWLHSIQTWSILTSAILNALQFIWCHYHVPFRRISGNKVFWKQDCWEISFRHNYNVCKEVIWWIYKNVINGSCEVAITRRWWYTRSDQNNSCNLN